jgi:antitoxin MazE
MMVEARVRKWGNSLGIRIPKSLAEDAGLRQDCIVSLEAGTDQLIVRPKSQKYKLQDLLDQVSPKNIHAETAWGKPVGNEVW